jgi:hypothetical protein
MTAVFERAKTIHVLNRAATVIGFSINVGKQKENMYVCMYIVGEGLIRP